MEKSSNCKNGEHNYQETPAAHGIERRTVAKGTEIWLAYVCTKCADCVQVKISTWAPNQNRNPSDLKPF